MTLARTHEIGVSGPYDRANCIRMICLPQYRIAGVRNGRPSHTPYFAVSLRCNACGLISNGLIYPSKARISNHCINEIIVLKNSQSICQTADVPFTWENRNTRSHSMGRGRAAQDIAIIAFDRRSKNLISCCSSRLPSRWLLTGELGDGDKLYRAAIRTEVKINASANHTAAWGTGIGETQDSGAKITSVAITCFTSDFNSNARN